MSEIGNPEVVVKKKRGRKKKSELEQNAKENENKVEEPPVPKKRGRKPKGGKLTTKPITLNDDNNPITNIILHLKKRKTPIILNQNGVFYPGWYEKNWKKKNQEMAFLYHQADYVFWQSNFCKLSANKFLGKRIGPGEILYNAVDTSFFKGKLMVKNSS